MKEGHMTNDFTNGLFEQIKFVQNSKTELFKEHSKIFSC